MSAFRLRIRVMVCFICLLAVSCTLAGAFLYKRSLGVLDSELTQRILSIAKTTAAGIDMEDHQALEPGMEGSAGYRQARDRLRAVVRANPDVLYVYTVVPYNDTHCRFILDADESEPTAIGEEYPVDPEMLMAFKGRVAVSRHFKTDDYGTYRSTYVPLRNAEGEVVAALGVDISATRSNLLKRRFSRSVSTMLGLLLLCSFVTVLLGVFIARSFARIRSSLMGEVDTLVAATTQGRLDVRGDPMRVGSDFRPIISGFNLALDAVVAPIREASAVLGGLALKDLTPRMKGEYPGEYGVISDNINRALDALEGTITSLNAMAERVALDAETNAVSADNSRHAAHEVAQGAQRVALGSEAQSVSAASVVGRMNSLTASINELVKGLRGTLEGMGRAAESSRGSLESLKQIADAASLASRISVDAGDSAENGAKAVQGTIAGMERVMGSARATASHIEALDRASTRIGDIVGTINDIAEQTNLLSLNAAIEAARAGEHGRGFAVVADEVRKLAERSAIQTKEVGAIIQGIRETIAQAVEQTVTGSREVEAGMAQASSAGLILDELVTSFQAVMDQTKEIADLSVEAVALTEDAVGAVGNVSSAMGGAVSIADGIGTAGADVVTAMDDVVSVIEESAIVTEEVSAASEEQAAAAESMSASMQGLAGVAASTRRMLAEFRVNGG